MKDRKLCKLLLVVLTLHFVRSNQKSANKECLRIIKKDAYDIIKPHLKAKNVSCRNQMRVEKNILCILNWTLAGSCTIFQDIQQMIKDSSEKCVKNTTRRSPQIKNCSVESFLKCWCSFMFFAIN